MKPSKRPSPWCKISARLRCAECGGQVQSVKPWRLGDVLGKPLGRRATTATATDDRITDPIGATVDVLLAVLIGDGTSEAAVPT
jgi:hypothetical protein